MFGVFAFVGSQFNPAIVHTSRILENGFVGAAAASFLVGVIEIGRLASGPTKRSIDLDDKEKAKPCET